MSDDQTNPTPEPVQPAQTVADAQKLMTIAPMQVDVMAPSNNNLRDILQSMVRVNQAGQYCDPNCAFCCSDRRAEAERLYENPTQPGSREVALQMLFAKTGLSISIDCIRNHIERHKDAAKDELVKLEYLEHLVSVAKVEQPSLIRLKLWMAALDERRSAVAALPDSKNGVISPRLVELKTKLIASLAKSYKDCVGMHAEIMGEMASRGEVFTLPKTRFKTVVESALRRAKTPAEQETILQIFEDMAKANED